MNTLREAVQSYLALRRGLGFKLLLAGNALQDFVTFMEKRRAVHITLRRALQWAQQPKHAQLATWAARFRLCPWICPVLQCHRSTHGDTTVRLDAVPAAPSEALPLQQRRS
jgi:hypothetical protein